MRVHIACSPPGASLYDSAEMVAVDCGEACTRCGWYAPHRKPSERPCASCGAIGFETDLSNYEGSLSRMLANNACASCQFWLDVLADIDTHVVIGGVAFACRPDDPKLRRALDRWGLGHGGREFHIRKNDGTTVVCNNLWNRGRVAPLFRDHLPDNAVFMEEPTRDR